ncbi:MULTISPECIES: hypothetical protein [unclassified Egicoccus]|uniref:hypothetical protein n=1 Tax=unclassified Egicoccus TaxID=2635606 RepID=UPI00359EEA9F
MENQAIYHAARPRADMIVEAAELIASGVASKFWLSSSQLDETGTKLTTIAFTAKAFHESAVVFEAVGVEPDVTFDDAGKPTATATLPSGLRVEVQGYFECERIHVGDETRPVYEYRLPEQQTADMAAA